MVQLYSRMSRSLALPISTMPRFIIPLADKLNSSIGGMPETFTRSTPGTYIDSNGVIQTAAIDEPRFQDGGLLIEPASTNLFINSSAPVTQNITVTSGTSYTVWGTGAGSIVLSGAGSGTVTASTPITLTASTSTLTCTVTNMSTVQVEDGVKTSYIPTAGAATTRTADVPIYNVSDVITQGQGSLYCEFYGSAGGTEARKILNLSDNSINNRIYTYISPVNGVTLIVVTDGVSQSYMPGGYISTELNKVLFTYKDNQVVLYINGVKRGEDLSCTIATNFTNLSVACGHDGTLQLNRVIGNVKYFSEALSDAEAIKLTTI